MKKKYELAAVQIADSEVFEQHLNEMSKQGWQLKKMNRWLLIYEWKEEINHYHCDFHTNTHILNNRQLDQKQKQQIAFYEEMNYHFVCCWRTLMIFKSAPELPALHTDEEIKFEAVKQSIRQERMIKVYIPIAVVSIALALIFSQPEAVIQLCLSNWAIGAWIIILLLLLVLCRMNWQNISPRHPIQWKQIKNRAMIELFEIAALIFFFFICMYGFSKNGWFVICVGISLLVALFECWLWQRLLSTNKISVVAWIMSSFLILSIITTVLFAWSSTSNDPVLQTGPVIFSEAVSGAHSEQTYYQEEESLLLHLTRSTIKSDSDQLDIVYLHVKQPFLYSFARQAILKDTPMEKERMIDDVQVSRFTLEHFVPLAMQHDAASCILLEHDQEMIRLTSSLPFTEDRIKAIIFDFGWD